MATGQDKAIAAGNTVIGFMSQLQGLRQQINDFITQYNSEGYSTIWNNQATAPQAANGTLGTADGTPNVAHPIDTRVAGQTLNKAVSANQLVAGVVVLQQLQNFFKNSAVTTGNYSQNVDDLAG